VQGQRAEAHARAHAVVLEPDILRGMSTLPLPPPPPPPMPRPPALVTVMPAPPATFPDATPAAGSATPGTPGEEHETMTLSKGTVRLGLRHRDSFAVHKSHLDHAHAGGDQIVAAIKSASAAGNGHSSMASMMSVSGVPSASLGCAEAVHARTPSRHATTVYCVQSVPPRGGPRSGLARRNSPWYRRAGYSCASTKIDTKSSKNESRQPSSVPRVRKTRRLRTLPPSAPPPRTKRGRLPAAGRCCEPRGCTPTHAHEPPVVLRSRQ